MYQVIRETTNELLATCESRSEAIEAAKAAGLHGIVIQGPLGRIAAYKYLS